MARYTKRGWIGTTPIHDDLNPNMRNLIAVRTAAVTTGTTVAAAATETSGNAQTYDLSSNNVLTCYFSEDAGTSFKATSVTVAGATPAASTAAEVVADLNADTVFAQYATAAVDGTSVKITTDARSTAAEFYVGGTANTPIGFTAVAEGSANAGTGTEASVSYTIKDVNGNAVPYAKVTATLYAGSTGDTKDATAIVNRLTTGLVVSGRHTNTCAMEADRNGQLVIKIADTGAGASTAHLEFTQTSSNAIISGKTDDQTDGARLSVTTGT